MTAPIAKFLMQNLAQQWLMQRKLRHQRESSFPIHNNALCEGAVVMLLHNILVEHKIMNGAVGVVKGVFATQTKIDHMQQLLMEQNLSYANY
jgi:hypothetical protein